MRAGSTETSLLLCLQQNSALSLYQRASIWTLHCQNLSQPLGLLSTRNKSICLRMNVNARRTCGQNLQRLHWLAWISNSGINAPSAQTRPHFCHLHGAGPGTPHTFRPSAAQEAEHEQQGKFLHGAGRHCSFTVPFF